VIFLNLQIIKKLSLFAYSNIYLALGAAFLSYASSILLIGTSEFSSLFTVFLMTFSMYTMNRITDFKEDLINHPERSRFIKKFGKILRVLAVLSYVLVFIISAVKGGLTFLPPFIVIIFGFLYSYPWIPKKSGRYRRLKDIVIIKNLTVSVMWAVTTVLVPVFYSYYNFSYSVLVVFLFVIFRLMINTVLFDARDVEGDKKEGVNTIPMVLGIGKSKLLLYLLNLTISVIIIISVFYGVLPFLAYFLLLSSAYAHIYIYLFEKKNISKGLLCDIVIDGEYILIGIYIFIGNLILA
jgi:4-hydroxybenzoate polyprenyltransferase